MYRTQSCITNISLILQLLVSIVLAAGCGHKSIDLTTSPHSQSAQDLLASVIRQIKGRPISHMEVFYEPPYILRFSDNTPDKLRRTSKYRVDIRDPNPAPSLVAALVNTSVAPSKVPADVIWGVDFALGDGSIREISVDRSGRRGYIDGVNVSFNGMLSRWLSEFTKDLP